MALCGCVANAGLGRLQISSGSASPVFLLRKLGDDGVLLEFYLLGWPTKRTGLRFASTPVKQRNDAMPENSLGSKLMNHFFSTTANKIGLAIVFTALVIVCGASVHGDDFDRIDSRAKKIQEKTRLLIKETVHYRHTPQYAALVNATTCLYDSATHVHKVAHFQNNLNHLQADLADLDRYFHQIEGLFKAAADSSSRGHGHVHGGTGRVKSLLRSIENNIDKIRRDVRRVQSRATAHQAVRHAPVVVKQSKPVTQNRIAQKYRPQYSQQRPASGISFSVGGGSSRLQLNF